MVSKVPPDVWDGDFATKSLKFAALALVPLDFSRCPTWPGLELYNHLAQLCGVTTVSGHRVRFVAAAPKPRGRRRKGQSQGLPYEHLIWQRGEVPTRPETWHDFFNMLAWCLFPRTKAAMNARQANLLVGARNAEQNLLCMVDEGGVFLIEGEGPAPLGRIHFGHAIHEAIMRGERGSEGLPVRLFLPEWDGLTKQGLDQVDAHVASLILSQRLKREPALVAKKPHLQDAALQASSLCQRE